ncbi:sensor histidine kinase [Faecalicatena acetigenes]|uniref:histidine kinase n=1 Tax=Faecalicatena acetigenes TaxID=2981790 RepID=A0ABT2TB10_9FIRM|nr:MULTISPECIES: sensor histidine kinase [Lachnospiraceae]MCU6747465.1 sensor histidine kinase [Faecalicatena acetigenes]SCH91011.1 Probable sensor-like histidine kinase YehU [uncultured Clostridium sp.]
MGKFREKCTVKFMNQSLQVKLVSLLIVLIVVLEAVSLMLFGRVMSDNYKKQIAASKAETLLQITANMDGSLYDIVEEMIFIKESLKSADGSKEVRNPETRYLNRDIVYRGYFNEMISRGNNYELVDSMMVLTEDESHFFSVNAAKNIDSKDILDTIWHDFEPHGPCTWTGILDGAYYSSNYRKEIISILMPVNGTGMDRSLLIVNLSAEQVKQYMERLGSGSERLFLDLGQGTVHVGKEMDQWTENDEAKRILKNKDGISEGRKYVILKEELGANDWKLYMICPREEMQVGVFTISTSLLLLILAAGCMIVIIGYFIVSSITRPLNKMTSIIIRNGENPQFPERFPVRYQDEVGVMAKAYNNMMDKIQCLMENIAEEQQQNKRNYLKLLQLQIKPHFLYNSLEATRFLVEMQDKNAVEMIDAIGRFYKLSLSGVEDIVSLSEEKEHLSCYMKILKLRYSSKYDYEIDIPEELEKYAIVKFSLQPLVENAIYHGVKMSREKGIIRIFAREENGKIQIHIWDNGAGIKKEKLKEIQEELKRCDGSAKREHIGIVNVDQRIRMFFAEGGISIDSEEGVFTDVTVRIPAKKYSREGKHV